MTLKRKSLSTFSWTKIALCATVLLPGFASATSAAPTLSDQEICQEVLPPSSKGYQEQQKIYKSLSIEQLEKHICELEQAWTKLRDTLDRGDTLADVYKVLTDVSTAPEIKKQANTALIYWAALALTRAELESRNQPFTPPANAEGNSAHEL